MSFDYTQWPTATDALARVSAASVTLRVAAGASRITNAVDGVIAEIGNRTSRQFLASTTPEVRLYDGTGTAEMEVDEMVNLTAVNVIGPDLLPVFTLDDAAPMREQSKPQTRITVARGSMPALAVGAGLPYRWHFPSGRQNIAVTGLFGYSAAIPADLWEAAAGEMAVRLAREGLFTALGRVALKKAGDEEERYALSAADALLWHDAYTQALSDYKRPSGRRLRNLRTRMI